jgi:putrescine transport system substrate-binding protein
MKSRIAAALLFLAAIPACSRDTTVPAAPAARTVNVYNWTDYIGPGVVEAFEKETGIHVNYDFFDSQELLETKLVTGKTGYDVVVVAGNVLERLTGLGIFLPLDRSLLPNWKNLDPDLMAKLARHDPGNRFAVGYEWGTTGIGYNATRLRELAPDAPTDSWRLIFDPTVVSRLAPCGVSIIEAPSEVIATVLAYLGRDPNSAAPADLQAAEKVLMAIRPSIRKIDSDSQITEFASGDVCLMLTWGTNATIARTRAHEDGRAADLRYVIPREGTISWFDTLAIPADAPHPAEAHLFIDYLMRAEVAAANANYIQQPTMNRAALPLISKVLRDDPSIFPPPEVVTRLTPQMTRSLEQTRAETRIWTRFKTGQ